VLVRVWDRTLATLEWRSWPVGCQRQTANLLDNGRNQVWRSRYGIRKSYPCRLLRPGYRSTCPLRSAPSRGLGSAELLRRVAAIKSGASFLRHAQGLPHFVFVRFISVSSSEKRFVDTVGGLDGRNT